MDSMIGVINSQPKVDAFKEPIRATKENLRQSFASLLSEIKEDPQLNPFWKQQRIKLLEKSYEFEANWIYQMFKLIRDSVDKSGFISGGQAEGIFQEMLDHQYCESMSKNHNFGIAAKIYNQLSKNLPSNE